MPPGPKWSGKDGAPSGEDVLLARVPSTGTYELRVSAGGEKLPPGRYAVSVEEIPAQDPRLAALERHRDGRRQTEDGEARRLLTAARQAWDSAGDRRMATHALVEIGQRSKSCASRRRPPRRFGRRPSASEPSA